MAEEFNRRLEQKGVPPHDLTLGSDVLETGLAIVVKRIDSGAVWVQTNHPHRKFWHRNSEQWGDYWDERDMPNFYANRDYPLLGLVRASASAPTYFDPMEISIDPQQTGVFFDGGVSPFNNPALELFFMSTLKAADPARYPKEVSPHGFGWENGADKIFLLSVGTGTCRERMTAKEFRKMNALFQAKHALIGMINDCSLQATYTLQSLASVTTPTDINFKLEDMQGLTLVDEPLLTFRRVEPKLEADWLEKHLGPECSFKGNSLAKLRLLDNKGKRNLEKCLEVGLATGSRLVSESDFPDVFNKGVFDKGKAHGRV